MTENMEAFKSDEQQTAANQEKDEQVTITEVYKIIGLGDDANDSAKNEENQANDEMNIGSAHGTSTPQKVGMALEFDWNSEPLDFNEDLVDDLISSQKLSSSLVELPSSQNVNSSKTDSLRNLNLSMVELSSSQNVNLSSASNASDSSVNSNKMQAKIRKENGLRIKNMIGFFKNEGVSFFKAKRVYQALYEDRMDLDVLMCFVITGQVVIIDQKLILPEWLQRRPLSKVNKVGVKN
ncbi:uncharacterized protein LOC129947151 isoform X2 [Eupeodes corollae]|uniref:uncharacterized protein LOC129947151 isoform X2 n=1 Tax=Eupeodes corollae TaxID=290404 RepID=UPI002490A2C6|nr:uncharacterized protein LOC129947151 isoform X2 [Eupeodes corollae]